MITSLEIVRYVHYIWNIDVGDTNKNYQVYSNSSDLSSFQMLIMM